eukprot:TRINITY_DN27112_c0_g1_i1.p1 TRINITY_DN27112_c0_g1~~TRINITY_DN27112_c0_g1_i1.p1  ORF type:complete len:257 (+),score=58.85 TRINITY_DN27112_c0_g1_i1:93-863(+)
MAGYKSAAAVVLLGAFAYGAFHMAGGKQSMRELVESAVVYIESQGDRAMLAYLAFTLIGVVALVPTTIMELAGGFLFSKHYGMWMTWALTCAAKLIANVISVFLARHFFRDYFMRTFVDQSELLTMVSKAVKEEPFKMAFLVRGSMVPLAVKNYGLGVLDIGYLPIACCACIFTPFYALQNIYVGSACQDIKEVFSGKSSASSSSDSWTGTLKAVLPIAFNLFLVFALIRAIMTQLKKTKASVEASTKAKLDAKSE